MVRGKGGGVHKGQWGTVQYTQHRVLCFLCALLLMGVGSGGKRAGGGGGKLTQTRSGPKGHYLPHTCTDAEPSPAGRHAQIANGRHKNCLFVPPIVLLSHARPFSMPPPPPP